MEEMTIFNIFSNSNYPTKPNYQLFKIRGSVPILNRADLPSIILITIISVTETRSIMQLGEHHDAYIRLGISLLAVMAAFYVYFHSGGERRAVTSETLLNNLSMILHKNDGDLSNTMALTTNSLLLFPPLNPRLPHRSRSFERRRQRRNGKNTKIPRTFVARGGRFRTGYRKRTLKKKRLRWSNGDLDSPTNYY